MARLSLNTRNRRERRIQEYLKSCYVVIVFFLLASWILISRRKKYQPRIRNTSSKVDRHPILHRYVYESDAMAISQIRMNRRCFTKLCEMLETLGGLRSSRNVSIDEQVAIFLHIIAHNVKNRVITCRFYRSGETISRYVSRVCNAVLRLHSRLLKKPEPVPENSTDSRWKWFKVHITTPTLFINLFGS